jgi:hypothetical protein
MIALRRSATLPPAIVEAPVAQAGAPRGGRRLVGHFAVFNRWSECLQFGLGPYIALDDTPAPPYLERIAVGAFARTFVEDRDQIRCTVNHGTEGLFGFRPLGRVLDLREDDIGARYDVELLRTPLIQNELVPGLEARLYGASFLFVPRRVRTVMRPKPSAYNRAGIPEVTILEARVLEFGPVWAGQYRGATSILVPDAA